MMTTTVLIFLSTLAFETKAFFHIRRHDIPITLVKYLRSNNIINAKDSCKCRYGWEMVNDTKIHVMSVYFDTNIAAEQTCEVFCIEGVPAASVIHNGTNLKGDIIVDSFHLNKGLLLLFDAGPHMRSTFYERYSRIDARQAYNRNDFLIF